MKSKGDRKSRTVEILVDGLKSPASVLAPLAPTRDMSFEQISLMFTQMQQMMQQLQKQNEQMHMTLQLRFKQQFGKSSQQLKKNPYWATLPLFAPRCCPSLPERKLPPIINQLMGTGRRVSEGNLLQEPPMW